MDDPGVTSLRHQLVDGLRSAGAITSSTVEAAFRDVPRHLFLPDVSPEEAYADEAVVTKRDESGQPISSSSQPAIVALMLEQLELSKGQRVLEIGAGTGYNAALLAHIVGAEGAVTTVDIDQDIADRARESLHQAGLAQVAVECGDGGLGFAKSAPYDRVIVTVGAWDLPPAWFDQLDDAGLLVVPLGLRGLQLSVCFELTAASGSASGRSSSGRSWRSRSIVGCGFMQMRGSFAAPGRYVALADKASLWVDDDRTVDVEGLLAAIDAPTTDIATDSSLSTREALAGLSLWLALTDPDYVRLHGLPEVVGAAALLHTGSFAAPAPLRSALSASATADAGTAESTFPDDRDEPFDVGVRGFGPLGEQLAVRLAAGIRAWDAAGRPSTTKLEIAAYAAGTPQEAIAAAYVIDKPHVRLGLTFDEQAQTSDAVNTRAPS